MPNLHLLEWLKLKKEIIESVGEKVEQLEHTYTASGSVKWYRHFGKLFGSSSKCQI